MEELRRDVNDDDNNNNNNNNDYNNNNMAVGVCNESKGVWRYREEYR